MNEREIIRLLAAGCPASPRQRNALCAADAEILEVGGRLLALTVDDYSAEDRLAGDDAELLGWNLVTATVSDLLAVGAKPHFLLDALVVTPEMDGAFLEALAAGMQAALTACGAALAGGDIGSAAAWRFTGVALGDFADGQVPFCRRLPPASGATGGTVLATGTFGDANLAAAAGGPAPRFESRLAASAALAALPPGAAPACIDTSDGLAAALAALCAVNGDLRIEIDPARVPFAPGVEAAAAAMGIPREAFLLGSAGEYELLALVPGSADSRLERAGLRRIGSFTLGEEPGPGFRLAGRWVALPELPDPRGAATFDEYRRCVVALAHEIFGRSGRA